MNRDSHAKVPSGHRAEGKANKGEPQKVIIEIHALRFELDKEHGDELKYASHSGLWRICNR
jgi:hypothetical protein